MFSKKPEPPETINNVALYQHQILDEAERELHRRDRAYAQEQRDAMELLARSLAPKFWEAAVKAGKVAQKDGPGMAALDLSMAIINEVSAAKSKEYETGREAGLATAGRGVTELTQLQAARAEWQATEADLRAELTQLQAQVTRLREQLAAAQAANARQAATAARQAATRPTPEKWQPDWPEADATDTDTPLPDDPADDADAPPEAAAEFVPAAPVSTWPSDLQEWAQQRSFSYGRMWLEIMGQTGEPFRSRVAAEFAQRAGLKKVGSGGDRALKDLTDLGFVTSGLAHLGQRAYGLMALTEQGLNAYRLLYGVEPTGQHYTRLLALHKSDDHTLLILLTQEVLERAGYQVERYPEPVAVGALGTMRPDLAAYRDGQTYYIEAETAAGKNDVQGEQKWRRVFTATGGRVYIAVPTQTDRDKVKKHLFLPIKDFPEVKVAYLVVDTALGLLHNYGNDTNIWKY